MQSVDTEHSSTSSTFKKKVFTCINERGKPLSIVDSLANSPKEECTKKIIPSHAQNGLREEFKRTFLPLLIDVFELRQMIQAHDPFDQKNKSPEEILKRLQSIQSDIEESMRWCNGVIAQISKGIEEAKALLDGSPATDSNLPPIEKKSLLAKLRSIFHQWF